MADDGKGLNPGELASLLNTKTVKLIDVRTPEEYEAGHLKGAQLINVYDSYFAAELDELNKAQLYVLYCANGKRSESARKLMEHKGFDNVYNLEGGIEKWQDEGHEVVY